MLSRLCIDQRNESDIPSLKGWVITRFPLNRLLLLTFANTRANTSAGREDLKIHIHQAVQFPSASFQ